eukprot:2635545-Pleurochrysis_carterae.AAC.2
MDRSCSVPRSVSLSFPLSRVVATTRRPPLCSPARDAPPRRQQARRFALYNEYRREMAYLSPGAIYQSRRRRAQTLASCYCSPHPLLATAVLPSFGTASPRSTFFDISFFLPRQLHRESVKMCRRSPSASERAPPPKKSKRMQFRISCHGSPQHFSPDFALVNSTIVLRLVTAMLPRV